MTRRLLKQLMAVAVGALFVASAALKKWDRFSPDAGTNAAITAVQTSTVTAMAPGVAAPTLSGTFLNENDGPVTNEKYVTANDADVIWKFDMMEEVGAFPHNLSNSSPVSFQNLIFVSTSNGQDESHVNVPSPKWTWTSSIRTRPRRASTTARPPARWARVCATRCCRGSSSSRPGARPTGRRTATGSSGNPGRRDCPPRTLGSALDRLAVGAADLETALDDFQSRQRRFGALPTAV